MTATRSTLAQAYRRVQSDLDRVETILSESLRGDRPETAVLCEHMTGFRGKMLRPALVLLSARATGGVRPIHHAMSAVVEMIHLATLIHDDVLDEALLRRGVPTINQGWGNETAVMLGDWLVSHAYHLCSLQSSQWASLELSRVAHRVCEGELMQLFRRGQLDLPADEYLAIIAAKTASLLGLSARIGAHLNDAPGPVEQACLDFGTDLGIAFQIADDVLDLTGDERAAGKTLGSDLAKRKATLPLIHYLVTAAPSDAQHVRHLLNGESCDGSGGSDAVPDDRLDEVRRTLVGSGAIQSAEAVAARYVESAKARLDLLPPGDARSDLRLLADFVLHRTR